MDVDPHPHARRDASQAWLGFAIYKKQNNSF
jgi:hypothetical protein